MPAGATYSMNRDVEHLNGTRRADTYELKFDSPSRAYTYRLDALLSSRLVPKSKECLVWLHWLTVSVIDDGEREF